MFIAIWRKITLTYLSLVFKNIRKFIQHKPFLFLFLVISQIVCVIVIFLVCGFVDNANRSSEVIQEAQKEFSITLIPENVNIDDDYFNIYDDGNGNYFYPNGTPISKEEMETIEKQKYPEGYYTEQNLMKNVKGKLEKFVKFLGDDYSSVSIDAKIDDTYGALDVSSKYPNGNDMLSKELLDFYSSSKKIVRLNPNSYTTESGEPVKTGDKIELGGVEYTVELAENDVVGINIPYSSLNDNFYVINLWMYTKNACSPERCEEISEKIKELFNTDNYYPPQPRILEELQNIQLAYSISAAVIIMILLNISKVYSYVLTYRKKSFAVMNICGASKAKIFLIYLIELMLTLIVTFGIALLIFQTLILQPISASYPNFLISMTAQTYLIIFGIYFVVAVLIMSLTISRFINKSAVEMERSGN